MTNRIELADAIARLFPDQVKVYKVDDPNSHYGCSTLLHQHFHEPLLADKQQQLANEIAGFLSVSSKNTVYSYFYRSHVDSNIEWHMATARLKKQGKHFPDEVIIFTYDLKLLGNIRERLYRVLEDDGFFKTHYNKVPLLTKREKEIVGFLASGNSSNDIATKLFVSLHTVNTHRKSINNKLGIKNIADLHRFAGVFELTQ